MRPVISFAVLTVHGLCATLSCAPVVEDVRTRESDPPARPADPPGAGQHPLSATRSSFTVFESGQVRPLALSPDRHHLFAVNTPDNRLEVFRIDPHGLTHTVSVPVG